LGQILKPISSLALGFEARPTKYAPNLTPRPCQQLNLPDFLSFA
jgi:hypothetical protein